MDYLGNSVDNSFIGNVFISEDLEVGGDLKIDGDVKVDGFIDFDNLEADNITTDKLKTLTPSGDLKICNSADVLIAKFNNNLSTTFMGDVKVSNAYFLPSTAGSAGQFIENLGGGFSSWGTLPGISNVLQEEIIYQMDFKNINPLSSVNVINPVSNATSNNFWQSFVFSEVGNYPNVAPDNIRQGALYSNPTPAGDVGYCGFYGNYAETPIFSNGTRARPSALFGGSQPANIVYLYKDVVITNLNYTKLKLRVAINVPSGASSLPNMFLCANYWDATNGPAVDTPVRDVQYSTTQDAQVFVGFNDFFPPSEGNQWGMRILQYELNLGSVYRSQTRNVRLILGFDYNTGATNQFTEHPSTNINGYGLIISRFQLIGEIVTSGAGTLTSDHNLLANLTVGDPHTQYLPSGGSRPMTGNLDMNSNQLLNVSNVAGLGLDVKNNTNNIADFSTTIKITNNTSSNCFAGFGNGLLNSGTFNTAFGRQGLANNTTASNNTAVGGSALRLITTSPGNTAVGAVAGSNISTGLGNNTCIGLSSGSSLTIGENCTLLGSGTNPSTNGATYAIAIGKNAVAPSKQMVIGGPTAPECPDMIRVMVNNTCDIGTSALVFKDGYISRTLLGTGTNALPSLAFAGDLDTGLYNSGANQVAIATGGTARLFITSTNIQPNLNIVSNGGIIPSSPAYSFLGSTTTGLYSPAVNEVALCSSSSEILRLNTSEIKASTTLNMQSNEIKALQVAKAWCETKQTSLGTQFNVDSISQNATGDFHLKFTNAMVDDTYNIQLTTYYDGNVYVAQYYNKAVDSFDMHFTQQTAVGPVDADPTFWSVVVFGN